MDIYLHSSLSNGIYKNMSKSANSTTTNRLFASYLTGFISSVILTVVAYLLVINHAFDGWAMFILLAILAFIQCVVQLVFFLHLAEKDGPRWKLGVFLFMLLVLSIVILGSLWIMHSLNYRMMLPREMNTYMQKQVNTGL